MCYNTCASAGRAERPFFWHVCTKKESGRALHEDIRKILLAGALRSDPQPAIFPLMFHGPLCSHATQAPPATVARKRLFPCPCRHRRPLLYHWRRRRRQIHGNRQSGKTFPMPHGLRPNWGNNPYLGGHPQRFALPLPRVSVLTFLRGTPPRRYAPPLPRVPVYN